ncbi:MAG TPA: AtpZ/AtpI family protein [Candidatus Saccharibacteria bacterium]|nr:AtpZ/AtpI family protein [Candidatus Saccharibacteria bacterium]HRK94198.1 AtpZ/AtpI family protein [Candidatus Saccharibacteria bacterium]
MSAPKSPSSSTPRPPQTSSTVILLLSTIADTTWRMFVPTLGGTGLGLWLDSQTGTTPWLGLAGLGIGIIITTLLMRQQFRNVNKS